MIKLIRKLWSYCVNCGDRYNFIQINGTWVCGNCGKPLQTAKNGCTIVT